MKTIVIVSTAALTLLLLTSCSSTNSSPSSDASNASLPPAAASVPATPTTSADPIFIGTGVAASAASGFVVVQAVDYTNRTCLLSRPDGSTLNFNVGPEYPNFDRIKVGDNLMSTATRNWVAYLVKGDVSPSSITNTVAQTKPPGSQPGGIMFQTVDYHAQVLDVDYVNRRVVLRYGVNQAKSVVVGPGVNLSLVHMNDNVLIRTTEAIAIAVVHP